MRKNNQSLYRLFLAVFLSLKPKLEYFFYSDTSKEAPIPVSDRTWYDKNMSIERFYVESFLDKQHTVINGRCLEISRDVHKKSLEGLPVQMETFSLDSLSSGSESYGSIEDFLATIDDGIYDCVIIVQVLDSVEDYRAVLSQCFRILKPGGVILCTFLSIAPSLGENRHFWGFTQASAEYIFGEHFSPQDTSIQTYGNALTGRLLLRGVPVGNLSAKEISFNSPFFPVVTTVKAIKSKSIC